VVEEAHQTAKDVLTERREAMDKISRILLERETIDSEQFEALLEGASEDEVFGDEEEAEAPRPEPEPSKPQREGPRPVPRPRPGLAGGTAEMRGDDPRR
jgi:cell division protease FtsH